MPAVLNLSNEVVKMRVEVKRVKVLIIRKLTRQISALKKKKGTVTDLERNQRRAARLLEEVHELKALAPDSITKAALQRDISFEKVCKNKGATLSERATARIASHPEFSRRIQSIKTAVEAFKAERTSAAKQKNEEKSREINQTENESDLDSEDEESEDVELEKNHNVHGLDQGLSEKIQKAEETSKQNALGTTNEIYSKTDSPPEVVRMRKEVKKLRVLMIRKITQQITILKKAKAIESEQQGHQECVAQLQKEVQVLREFPLDKVTRGALKWTTDLEKAIQDPESSLVERAIARIATHSRFIKKLQDVRVAIEEERNKAAKDEQANKTKDIVGEVKSEDTDSEHSEVEDKRDLQTSHEDVSDNEKIKITNPSLKRSNVVITTENLKPAKDKLSTNKSERGEPEHVMKCSEQVKSSKIHVKPGVLQRPPSKTKETASASKPVTKLAFNKPENRVDKDSESDVCSSDEEKEYFDDSTEERFHNQSSHSEQSDDDDNFFLGKVSKLKKKKGHSTNVANTEKKCDPKETATIEEAQKIREASQFKMQSVFCTTLSKMSANLQKEKHGRPKPAHFQNQNKLSDKKPYWFKGQDSGTKKMNFNSQSGPTRKPTFKPAFERQGNKPGKHLQQALHPSWEASRKRKEQQAQITAFQGKKIKFDDD